MKHTKAKRSFAAMMLALSLTVTGSAALVTGASAEETKPEVPQAVEEAAPQEEQAVAPEDVTVEAPAEQAEEAMEAESTEEDVLATMLQDLDELLEDILAEVNAPKEAPLEAVVDQLSFNMNATEGVMSFRMKVKVEAESFELAFRLAKANVAETEVQYTEDGRMFNYVLKLPVLDGFEVSVYADCTNVSDETLQKLNDQALEQMVTEILNALFE